MKWYNRAEQPLTEILNVLNNSICLGDPDYVEIIHLNEKTEPLILSTASIKRSTAAILILIKHMDQ